MEKHITLDEILAEIKFNEDFIRLERQAISTSYRQIELALADLERLRSDADYVCEGGVILSEEED